MDMIATTFDMACSFRGKETKELQRSATSADVEEHPGSPESVAQHGKPVGEEGLLHLHEDLPALRENAIDALGFLLAVDCERQICAPHRLTLGNVGAH